MRILANICLDLFLVVPSLFLGDDASNDQGPSLLNLALESLAATLQVGKVDLRNYVGSFGGDSVILPLQLGQQPSPALDNQVFPPPYQVTFKLPVPVGQGRAMGSRQRDKGI